MDRMDRLKQIGLGAVVLALLWFAWNGARRALATPEELIRWQLDEMVDGFHSNTLRHVLRGFDRDYRDSSGLDRDDVKDGLIYLFFQDRDSATRSFAYRLEIPEQELTIRVDEDDENRATATLRAVFYKTTAGKEELWWDMHATLVLEKDGDWQITETRDVNHRDRHR